MADFKAGARKDHINLNTASKKILELVLCSVWGYILLPGMCFNPQMSHFLRVCAWGSSGFQMLKVCACMCVSMGICGWVGVCVCAF